MLKPDTAGRASILRVHARKHPVDETVDFDQVARDLPGLSGAELANILNEVSSLPTFLASQTKSPARSLQGFVVLA